MRLFGIKNSIFIFNLFTDRLKISKKIKRKVRNFKKIMDKINNISPLFVAAFFKQNIF